MCDGRWGKSKSRLYFRSCFCVMWNCQVIMKLEYCRGGCFLMLTTSKWFSKDDKPKSWRYTYVSHTEITCGKMLIISKSSWRIYRCSYILKDIYCTVLSNFAVGLKEFRAPKSWAMRSWSLLWLSAQITLSWREVPRWPTSGPTWDAHGLQNMHQCGKKGH